jgi:hypothetical protein
MAVRRTASLRSAYDPRIHVFVSAQQGVDGRVKPGHDDGVILTLYPPRHCEERSDEAIQFSACRAFGLDCFAEPVIGRRHSASKTRVNALSSPTRWLAMTMVDA